MNQIKLEYKYDNNTIKIISSEFINYDNNDDVNLTAQQIIETLSCTTNPQLIIALYEMNKNKTYEFKLENGYMYNDTILEEIHNYTFNINHEHPYIAELNNFKYEPIEDDFPDFSDSPRDSLRDSLRSF